MSSNNPDIPVAKIRLDFPQGSSVGPGKIALLEKIDDTGSLSAAARVLGMSYRRAWLLIQDLNNGFDRPAVSLSTGGKHGGGATLTAFGHALVTGYRALEAITHRLATEIFAELEISAAITPQSPLKKRLARRTGG